MICQVLYYQEDSKAMKSKGFSSPEEAKKWMSAQDGNNNRIQNSRIVVGYEAVEVYKEMYELLKAEVFSSVKQNNKREI